MAVRLSAMALLLGLLTVPFTGAPPLYADDDRSTKHQSNDQCVVRRCSFFVEVPPRLQVSRCLPTVFPFTRTIQVETNTRNRVCIRHTDYERVERDCKGNLLKTKDRIPAVKRVKFKEVIHCRDGGSPLEVEQLTTGASQCWCVNPHRGGYAIILSLLPDGIDPCDDAGCYVATATVEVCLLPFKEECPIEELPPGPPTLKGNNGVGNGEDPQPPGNPPINDGPGTSPGDPGNKGGAQD